MSTRRASSRRTVTTTDSNSGRSSTSSRRTVNSTDSNSGRCCATNRRPSRPRRSTACKTTARRTATIVAAAEVAADTTCIDLTNEPPAYHDAVVDLTSVTDSPVVVLGSQEVFSPGRQRQQNSRDRLRQIDQLDLDDSDSELEELPDLDFIRGSPSESKGTTEGSTTANQEPVSSPEAVPLVCPVCLDSQRHIRRTGRQLMSTMCGHIFCSECVDEILQTQQKCPNCRQKLTRKKVHPIYF